MSVAERAPRRRRCGICDVLDRVRAVGALVLLVIFVLLGGARVLEDDDEE